MPLIGADVGGAALGAEDAVEVSPGHAGGAPGGTGGGARINRHRAALEMVIPGHVPGVVHKQGVELGSRERHGARLGARDQVHAPAGAVIDNVVVEHVVGADGGPFIDAIGGAGHIHHHDVVVHGHVIGRRDGGVGGDRDAGSPAVGHHVVGDDLVGAVVPQVNAGGGRSGDDIVLDDAVGTRHVDAVNLVGLPKGTDVVHHIAEDLVTREDVSAAIHEDPRIAAPAGQVMDAVADQDRKSTRLNSSHSQISYAVFCLKKKKKKQKQNRERSCIH